MSDFDIAAIAAKAAVVGALVDENEAARAAELQAEGEVLASVVEAIRPALRAVSSRIPKVDQSTAGRNGCNPVSEKAWHDERGLCLVDNWTSEKDSSGNEGYYGGERLYLLSDGCFAVVKRKGTWSRWQGAWSGFESTLKTCGSAHDVMTEWDLDECLTAIETAVSAQAAGNLGKRAAQSRARAEKIRAVAALAK